MANKPAKLLGLAHIGIYTKDLEASKAFYTKLGFRLDGESCPGAKLAFMSLGSCLLELIQLADPAAQLPGDAPKDEPALSEQAQAVYRLLTARPQGLETLCAASGLPSGVVMAALTELELAGLSRQLAGRQFERRG